MEDLARIEELAPRGGRRGRALPDRVHGFGESIAETSETPPLVVHDGDNAAAAVTLKALGGNVLRDGCVSGSFDRAKLFTAEHSRRNLQLAVRIEERRAQLIASKSCRKDQAYQPEDLNHG